MGLKHFPWSPSVPEGQTIWLTWQHDIEKSIVVLMFTGIILTLGLRSIGMNWKFPRPGFLTVLASSLQESIIDQVHWAFYRELCIRVWGITRGSWIVMIPLSLELLLNPATWTRIKDQRGINTLVVNSGILIASTMLFMQIQNIWLMLCMEFALRMMFARVYVASKRL